MTRFSSEFSLPEVETYLMTLLAQSSFGIENPICLTTGIEFADFINA
jgi:hypothetical protein